MGQRGTVRDAGGVAPGLCDRVAALIEFERPVLLESLKVFGLALPRVVARARRTYETCQTGEFLGIRRVRSRYEVRTKSVRSQGLFEFYFRSLFSLPDFANLAPLVHDAVV